MLLIMHRLAKASSHVEGVACTDSQPAACKFHMSWSLFDVCKGFHAYADQKREDTCFSFACQMQTRILTLAPERISRTQLEALFSGTDHKHPDFHSWRLVA